MRPKILATLLLAAFFGSILTSYAFAYQKYRPSAVTGPNRWERVSDDQMARDDEMAMDEQECKIIDMRKSEEGNIVSDTLNFAGETVRGVTGNERMDDFKCEGDADAEGVCPSAVCPTDSTEGAVCPAEDEDGGLMSLLTAPFRYAYAAGEALLGGGGAAPCP